MTWLVGRFVRGTIDEDVSGGPDGIDHDVVFEPERIAAALAAVERGAALEDQRS
jgi:hypothetical protein